MLDSWLLFLIPFIVTGADSLAHLALKARNSPACQPSSSALFHCLYLLLRRR